MTPFLIGIAGGTGSGKSTLARNLIHEFGQYDTECAVISFDHYYRDQEELTFEERTEINYDHPDSLETELLVEHLELLKQGQAAEVPIYDFSEYTRSEKVELVYPAPIIIVEGILLFHDQALREMFDYRVFVDAPIDIRLIRRLERDIRERSRSFEYGVQHYLATVRPMHAQYVEPSLDFADFIVKGGGENWDAIAKIVEVVREKNN